MDLTPFVEDLRRQIGEAGGSATESVLQLALLDVLGAAAAEITRELAPGSVDLRLRGREPEFVVTSPPAEVAPHDAGEALLGATDDAATARINVRLPDSLKGRIEQAADREGLSVNAWLVRAAAAALGSRPRAPRGSDQYRGWVR
ncbi:MAG TPA: ribbon-helix-helix protein, CopG family [Solirubrobacter sp.]|jgi:hypothetical protein|nr:ribbon-helix-helix protein, CopG family [Solirubrobacter sp.]